MAPSPELKHLALIPDGNRRWAAARSLPPEAGHARAFQQVAPDLIEAAWQEGVHTVTLWLFSTENWRRSAAELHHLMAIFLAFIARIEEICPAYGARVCLLGRLDRVPADLRQAVEAAVARPSRGERVLNVALDYGGGDELLRAFRRMAAAGLDPDTLREEDLGAFLDTAGQPYPEPDLILRTSGEQRLSGLMPWQGRYSELCFLDHPFPDLTRADLHEAIRGFQARQRRWGS